MELERLTTEQRNQKTMQLDDMSAAEIIEVMNGEDLGVVEAVRNALPQVKLLVEAAVRALSCSGRIIYVGAGTSGRLGILDAVECPPTFGVSYDTVVGVIAGGENAFVKAKEGAEDDEEGGAMDLKRMWRYLRRPLPPYLKMMSPAPGRPVPWRYAGCTGLNSRRTMPVCRFTIFLTCWTYKTRAAGMSAA